VVDATLITSSEGLALGENEMFSNRSEVSTYVSSNAQQDDRALFEVSYGAGILSGYESKELLVNFICFLEGMDKSQYQATPDLFA
jgi:hypothetical protein